MCRRFAEEVLEREARVLTEKVQIDLDANASTRLDANHATDDSDFVARERDEEGDLRIKRQPVIRRDETPTLAQVGELQRTRDRGSFDAAIEEHRATEVSSSLSERWCHAGILGCSVD